MSNVLDITSRHNPRWQALRRLAREPAAYRQVGEVWLSGEHLLQALGARGGRASEVVISQSAWEQPALRSLTTLAPRCLRLPDTLFAAIGDQPSTAGVAAVVATPTASALDPLAGSVVLDRLQDAGNVGSILRSAAALGFAQVLALPGTAALWSPKVLRAAMGAHFGLRLIENADLSDLVALQVPLLATSSHGGDLLHAQALPWPCAWLFGHEGQGLAAELQQRAARLVRIAQPGGEESLNVAAAAAICLHASACSRPAQTSHGQ
ncbi:MAG: TrmH family RNA methyltransferase [Aquabacterium sp.]